MRYAGLIKNDLTAGSGLYVTLFVQGCPLHCNGCHNPETWNFDGGFYFNEEIINEIKKSLIANNIIRNFAIMGGEPLCKENRKDVLNIIWDIRHDFPNIKIGIWTGYKYEKLQAEKDAILDNIFANINFLVDGPYIEELKNKSLGMKGSSNQRIIRLKP